MIRRFLRFNSTIKSKYVDPNILHKYQAKLELKAKQEGLTVKELHEKFKPKIEKIKSENVNLLDQLKNTEKDEKAIIKDRGKTTAKKAPYKTLDDFIAVDKVEVLPKDEITRIWSTRFANKERALHAVIDNLQFAQMYANAFKNPNFLLPIPKQHEGKDGYEMEFVQWSFVGPATIHCMFTTLAEYKLHNEYAKPHTTLSFHQELAHKDIVLMNGISEKEGGLTMQEAQLLVVNLQRFYSGQDPAKLKLVKQFNSGVDFNVDELIKESSTF